MVRKNIRKKKPIRFAFFISHMEHFNFPFLNRVSRPNSVEDRTKHLSTV